MQPPDPHGHAHGAEHRAGAGHVEHRDRIDYNEYNTGAGHRRLDTDAPAPIPPTSPTLTGAFHRPGAQAEAGPSLPGLRRRMTQPRDTLRVAVATPFNDNDRRKERSVSAGMTVKEFKDLVAGDEEEKWARASMRLVWQGRIVRDEEVLGGIIGKHDTGQVHTFHLVARRLDPARSGPVTATRFAVSIPHPPRPDPSPACKTRNAQAIEDTLHFTLFLARHHLSHLLGVAPLAWEDAVPKPTIDQPAAKSAIMSVLRAYVALRAGRDEAWENWELAYEDVEDFVWDEHRRFKVSEEVRAIWSGRVGRHWRDGPAGEQVGVELDGIPYLLHLPPLDLMSPAQLVHLVLYLRLTTILPLINILYTVQNSASPAPTPTMTVPAPAAVAPTPPRLRQYGFRLRLNMATASHVFFSAVKVGAMLWMLTKDMKWDDFRLWIIGGGLLGWWLGDAMNQLRPGLIWNNGNGGGGGAGQAGQAGQPGQARPAAPGVAGVAGAAGPPGDAAGGAGAEARAGPPTPPRLPAHNGNVVNAIIPVIHLDTDAEQLLLSGRRPEGRPMRLVTQLLLPVALWFITLIPEWETVRAGAIRRRERAIRVWVGELTEAAERERAELVQDGAEVAGVGQEAEARSPVFPEGLSVQAKRYFERVVERGEGIDWEEEREAQRAMGIADENEREDDDGMRMRML